MGWGSQVHQRIMAEQASTCGWLTATSAEGSGWEQEQHGGTLLIEQREHCICSGYSAAASVLVWKYDKRQEG